MNSAAGGAEKLLASLSIKKDTFNMNEQIAKIQNLSIPEVLTLDEVRETFLIPLQQAIDADNIQAKETEAEFQRLVDENEALKKTVSKLEYRINHIFRNNEIKPKPID
ncbi:hypothetical protein XU18_1262 [Perkinsela sp. CCAP 1560/4]|nr:developmentally regulated GTP-binding protein [Perkinsela sp. CCAP 1560/4]KNH08149.1 hypothetical protein XU18_1262 [Perkinsela sp. CCAP 1560/4]|eukprot:KNH06830.1 developmentally regulated GTP-binding protein [Perkinsela sp. CCAP 1560/4]